ncbi:MAG: hypothetical protein JWM09_959 [Francisellaceae bacterium]|nr:hypothetical protein [Francisellaceae bacterium]
MKRTFRFKTNTDVFYNFVYRHFVNWAARKLIASLKKDIETDEWFMNDCYAIREYAVLFQIEKKADLQVTRDYFKSLYFKLECHFSFYCKNLLMEYAKSWQIKKYPKVKDYLNEQIKNFLLQNKIYLDYLLNNLEIMEEDLKNKKTFDLLKEYIDFNYKKIVIAIQKEMVELLYVEKIEIINEIYKKIKYKIEHANNKHILFIYYNFPMKKENILVTSNYKKNKTLTNNNLIKKDFKGLFTPTLDNGQYVFGNIVETCPKDIQIRKGKCYAKC